ncbi:putative membrane protein [Gluconacetobacter diazotrophicus PA1 5]|uniref:Putative membrane protein n=1 Tax=Gluconacetobacter diazotrophicus (strain ATCC 49037 / DSM 5601 / CCUG 37298 / CIP 103539 / LMG 7603 / PAl5) TaxID=272568 RepID=A9HK05_GLUDA|nr:putative membrane protein [Gluconacetobacter diazotrophicus PA1 5]
MAFSPDFRTMTRPAGAGTDAGAIDQGLRAYMLRVYNWMASGLVLTGTVAYLVANTSLRAAFFAAVMTPSGVAVRPTGLGMLAMIAPLGFVLVMSLGVNRLSRQAVQALFWLFCAVMGASLSSILLTFTGVSVVRVFFVTAGTFSAMSIWGYVTRTDLTRFGSFLLMGLFGLVIAGLVNMFLHSSALYMLYSVVGVFIFVGLAASTPSASR